MNSFIKIKIISKKYGTIYTLIDNEDIEKISKLKLRVSKSSNSDLMYIKCRYKGNSKSYNLHNIIMNENFIDHINGNTLDNRKINLRKSCCFTNNRNAKKRKDYKYSKYKGVGKSKDKWIARIQYNKKRIKIGTFKTELEAAKAYDAEAKKLHKEFAKLNFSTTGSNNE